MDEDREFNKFTVIWMNYSQMCFVKSLHFREVITRYVNSCTLTCARHLGLTIDLSGTVYCAISHHELLL